MNKKTLKVLVLALAVLFPMQNVFADYCTKSGNSTHSARYLSAFTLTDGTNEAVVSGVQTSTGKAVYHDKTSVVLETEAGATISFASITWAGEWMHGYLFADFNNDETFDSSDVVSYNFYSSSDASSGQNSKGETVQNSCNVTAANMPEWTIPSDLAAGDYRARFKVDWNSLDPCGASDIAGNGGAMVDFTIRIASQATSRTISVSVSPEETGTVTINGEEVAELTAEGGITLVATPAEGYKFANWTLDGEVVSTNATFIDGTDGDKAYVANFVEKENVTVSVSVNDETMGYAYASAEGTVLEGTEITLTATPAEGYVLENWTVNGTVVSEETTFVTTVTASAEYVANFKEKSNKIAPTAVESNMAQWSSYYISNVIDGSYTTNYESNNYMSNGGTVTLTFDLNKVLDNVVIYFGGNSYTPTEAKLQVSTDGSTWLDIEGSEFGNADLDSNKTVTIDCKKTVAKQLRMYITNANTGYLKIYEFEVYGKDVTVAARTISVSVNDAEAGSAYIGEAGVTEVAGSTAVVQMTAVANEGYEFVNWTVGEEVVGTTATIVDATDGDKAYVANFVALAKYNLTVSVNDVLMGSVEATKSGEVFKYTEATLTAVANEGYEFVKWTLGDADYSTSATINVTVTEDAEYVANFRLTPTKVEIVSAFESLSGNDLTRLYDGQYNTYYYASGGQVGSYVGVVFKEEALLGDIILHYPTSSSYRPSSAKIQVSTDNETWTDLEGGSFTADDIVSNSKTGYKYVQFDGKDTPAKYLRVVYDGYYSSYYKYIYINEIEVFEAPVNVAPRTISVSVNDETMGTAYVGIEGTTELTDQTGAVRMVATTSDNAYRFVNWTVEGEVVSTNSTFVDRTEGSKAYVANFEAKPIYTVSVASATAKRGSASCDAAEVVYEGDVVTFTATPTDGYGFVNWTVNGEVVSTQNPYAMTITESVDLVANFDINPELNRSEWTVYTVSSEYAGLDNGQYVDGAKAIDGKVDTYWHTDWDAASNKKVPQWIVFNLGSVKAFDSFNYLSRSESQNANGNIGGYKLYVSDEAPDLNDLTGSMTEVNEGTFTYPGQEHKVELGKAVSGQYVMLYATSTYGEGGANLFANCAEFYLYLNSYSVTVSSSNPAHGIAYIGEEGVTAYPCSVEGTDVVTITAVAAEGYQFVNWTLEGEVISTEAVYTTDAVTEGRDYVANFEFAPIAPRTITAAVNNAAKGSVVFLAPESTESSVVYDNIAVLKATPASSDDFFMNWTINGEVVGTEDTYEYLGAEDVTIQANFESRYVVTVAQAVGGTITVKANGSTISTGDRVLEGSSLTISVVENEYYELKKLFVNGEDVFAQYKKNPDFAVAVTGSVAITAEYGDPVCIITWENIGNGYVEVWEYDNFDADADEAGEMEYPLQPDGEQYAWGTELPFLGTAAIFAYPMGDDELVSLTINGEEINLDEEWYPYEDYFIDEVAKAIHIVATFTGEGTGIETAEADAANVYAVAGGIKVATAEAATVSIYSIAGVLVSEQTVSETTTIAMEKGIYIVKVADKVAKVIVK